MKKLDIQKLKDGKYYRRGIDGKIFEFNSDKEAIRYCANYEEECYKLILENDEIQEKCIYDPYACFG